jgi:hypothetical protein
MAVVAGVTVVAVVEVAESVIGLNNGLIDSTILGEVLLLHIPVQLTSMEEGILDGENVFLPPTMIWINHGRIETIETPEATEITAEGTGNANEIGDVMGLDETVDETVVDKVVGKVVVQAKANEKRTAIRITTNVRDDRNLEAEVRARVHPDPTRNQNRNQGANHDPSPDLPLPK